MQDCEGVSVSVTTCYAARAFAANHPVRAIPAGIPQALLAGPVTMAAVAKWKVPSFELKVGNRQAAADGG